MAPEKLPCHTHPVLIVSHLLFADDNESMRNMVRALLEASGHTVELAPDGAAALASVHAREPDLLILDLEMPGMSGFEVCRAVKQNPFTARVPVLMLTGQGDVSYKVAGFEAGADDYLAKPFDPRELRARVAALLRRDRVLHGKRVHDGREHTHIVGGGAVEAFGRSGQAAEDVAAADHQAELMPRRVRFCDLAGDAVGGLRAFTR